MQRQLFEYITLPGPPSVLQDVSITLTDKTDPSCLNKRKLAIIGYYWQYTLKTKAPMGLNFHFEVSF